MSDQTESYLRKAEALGHELSALATYTEQACSDDNSLLAFCGVLRDCAYRIQRDAASELQRLERVAVSKQK